MIEGIDFTIQGVSYLGVNQDNFSSIGLTRSAYDEQALQAKWKVIRTRRDALLRACDYAVMPDYPLTDEQLDEVKAYRQALRDIPETAGDPDAVEWPAKPEVLA